MTCDSISKFIPLYYYGELSPEEEERVEALIKEANRCVGATMVGRIDKPSFGRPDFTTGEYHPVW